MGKKMIVLFPGVNYGVDCPLLYYAGFIYEMAGYEKIRITSYEVNNLDGLAELERYANRAKQKVKKMLQEIPFEEYEDIIFASKSVGTVIALWLEEEWQIKNVTHLLLTPIDLTLPLMEKERKFRCVVTGLKDNWVNHEKLREICGKRNYPLTEFDNVGHRLETKENVERNLAIVQQVIKLYE